MCRKQPLNSSPTTHMTLYTQYRAPHSHTSWSTSRITAPQQLIVVVASDTMLLAFDLLASQLEVFVETLEI